MSEAKGALDEAKGAVLTEVSSTVEAITTALRQKKAQLAPQVAELRSTRAACTVRSLGGKQFFPQLFLQCGIVQHTMAAALCRAAMPFAWPLVDAVLLVSKGGLLTLPALLCSLARHGAERYHTVSDGGV